MAGKPWTQKEEVDIRQQIKDGVGVTYLSLPHRTKESVMSKYYDLKKRGDLAMAEQNGTINVMEVPEEFSEDAKRMLLMMVEEKIQGLQEEIETLETLQFALEQIPAYQWSVSS